MTKTAPSGERRWTKQQMVLVSEETNAAINVLAREQGLSKAAVIRALISAGLEQADMPDVRTANPDAESRLVERLTTS